MDDDLPPCPATDLHPQHLSGRVRCDMSAGHPEDPADTRHAARIGTHVYRWPNEEAPAMSTESITVQALADELKLPAVEVGQRVSALCKELGAGNVVAEALWPSGKSVLTGSAADLIRDDLATA